MKTITAKQFQLNLSQVMKEVANGTPYTVTFHGKPTVQLQPAHSSHTPKPGSKEAFLESLKYTLKDADTSTFEQDEQQRYRDLNKKYGLDQ